MRHILPIEMSARTAILRLGVVRIAMALAVAGVGVLFVAAAPAPSPTPTPTPGTSVESSDVGAVVDSDDDGGPGRNARISTILQERVGIYRRLR